MQKKNHHIAAFLFLILSLHTFIIELIQGPDNFISLGFENDPLTFKLILYLTAIIISLLNPFFGKYIGLKKILILGLLCDCLGLILILLYHQIGLPSTILYIATGFFGIAYLSITNSLITFTVLSYPHTTILAMIVFFSFFNFGIMCANFLFQWANFLNLGMILALIGIVLLSIWMVKALFIETPYPKHMEHLRSGTLIWVEMHKRLILYILLSILYAFTESIFSLWGEVFARLNLTAVFAEIAVGTFWLSVIMAQLVLVLSYYHLDFRKILYFLTVLIILSALYIPTQAYPSRILLGFIVGGAGCAALSPLIFSSLEMEVVQMALASQYTHYLPLIEISVSLLTTAYIFGYAIVDVWMTLTESPASGLHFYLAPLIVFSMMALLTYLNKTRKFA